MPKMQRFDKKMITTTEKLEPSEKKEEKDENALVFDKLFPEDMKKKKSKESSNFLFNKLYLTF